MIDKRYRKEGNAEMTAGAVVTLVVGVGVAVLVLIFVGTLGGRAFTLSESGIKEIDSLTITENITSAGARVATLSNVPVIENSVNIYNGTIGTNLMPTSNFTVNTATGVVTFNDLVYNGTEFNATYAQSTGGVRDSVINSIQSSFDALEQTGSYMPIIVLAIVISMVLGLILTMGLFGRGRMGGGSAL